jgi:hypothetical protein
LPGGTVPSGRILVRAEPDGGRLLPDPDYASVVLELVRRYLAGDLFRTMSRWLSQSDERVSGLIARVGKCVATAGGVCLSDGHGRIR